MKLLQTFVVFTAFLSPAASFAVEMKDGTYRSPGHECDIILEKSQVDRAEVSIQFVQNLEAERQGGRCPRAPLLYKLKFTTYYGSFGSNVDPMVWIRVDPGYANRFMYSDGSVFRFSE